MDLALASPSMGKLSVGRWEAMGLELVSVGAISGVNSAIFSDTASSSLDLVRGAIGGAFIIGVAFLAGFAVFRRNSAAVCALLMVLAAAALEFSWLGLFKVPSPKVMVLLQGVFGASILIYLSATIRAVKNNAILGGLMFAGALTMIGVGVINFLGRVEANVLMLNGLFAVGGFAVLLTLVQSARGDHGARLLLPGALITMAAPFTGHLFGADAVSMTPHALFTFGILTASLVALTESAPSLSRDIGFTDMQPAMMHAQDAQSPEEKMLVSENQLAQVLDYSGVAVWDWSENEAHQTESFAQLFEADDVVRVTPRRLRDFIHPSDRARFEHDVFGRHQGDGAFDISLKLRNDNRVRLRGARAVDPAGELERLVVFAEKAADDMPKLWDTTPAIAGAAGAAVATLKEATAKEPRREKPSKISRALEAGHLRPAFQAIVSLEDSSVRGYEALLRFSDEASDFKGMSTEEIVAAADAEGKGADLASMMLKASAEFLSGKIKTRGRKDLFAAFNVSVAQLQSAGFADAVAREIKAHGLAKKSLVVELTESEAVTDEKAAGEIFAKLKEAGAALAFDDFGAGFSSLSNLHKFSFDYLKVDKSFIEKLDHDEDAAKIVGALVSLGGDLGLEVIAEGVSTKALAQAALKSGCKLGQGFALGQPETVAAGKELKGHAKEAAANADETPADDEPKQKPSKLFAKASDKAETSEPEAKPEEPANDEKKPSKRRFWSNELR